jgi:hypothetical protein
MVTRQASTALYRRRRPSFYTVWVFEIPGLPVGQSLFSLTHTGNDIPALLDGQRPAGTCKEVKVCQQCAEYVLPARPEFGSEYGGYFPA